MELKKEISKLQNKRRCSTDIFTEEDSWKSCNSPVPVNNCSEDEESPYFPCSTQELREDVDVLWDYNNSPQSKHRSTIVRKPQKKLYVQPSPKVPFRRHLSNNNEQIKQDFCKVRAELMALRAEMAKPDHEQSLILSPREEETFKIDQDGFDNIFEDHSFESECEDPFNDDMDDKLIFCSQQVEMKLPKYNTEVNNELSGYKELYDCDNLGFVSAKHQNIHKMNVNSCDTSSTNQKISSLSNKNLTSEVSAGFNAPSKKYDSDILNDSFDNISQINEDDFDQPTQVVDIKQYGNHDKISNFDNRSKLFPGSYLEEDVQTSQMFLRATVGISKVEWHRTQSFENYNNSQITTEKQQEIESRLLEVKAKKKLDCGITTIPEYTVKCTPEEIEKKKLEAMARREAKLKQEIIEKNRQEALKRREESARKHSQVKSSLAARF